MITIVIVEDQGILRESLACTLNLQEDMQVARALSDAADALDVVRETNANLALLDVCTENGSSGIAARWNRRAPGNYSLNRQRLLHLPECNPEYLLERFGTQRNRDQYLALGLRSKNA